ncbi:RDD family protein [Catellatospora bangladeshensis]|uniref:RDD family protein n=1 Tax=Catellatospora bangladeshensis TaxID=310355 RepID=UPI001945196E|nr:RDD family protein [Catellatospora bangladeshensis]
MTSPSPSPFPPPAPQPGAAGAPATPWSTQPAGWVPPPPPPGTYQPLALPLAPNGLPLASFGDRLLAFLLDALIASAISMVVTLPLTFIWMFSWISTIEESASSYDAYGDPVPPDFWALFGPMMIFFVVVFGFTLIFTYLYYVEYQLRKGGQTVGKKTMKIRVVMANPAEVLDRGALTKRWAVERVVGLFVPFFSYLDGFWQLWDKPLQQCLHDKAARTVVVKVG